MEIEDKKSNTELERRGGVGKGGGKRRKKVGGY